MTLQDDDDFRAAIGEERREARRAAKAFADAAASGDVERFFEAVDAFSYCVGAWEPAMRRVARLDMVSDQIRAAFLNIWIEHKMHPLEVGNRPVLARALRVLLPRQKNAGPLQLYRGANASERRRRLYGFSWSTNRDIARGFAEHWQRGTVGGVVLETLATPEAILHLREPEDYYDEAEVVVDPFKLGKVKVAEHLPASPHA